MGKVNSSNRANQRDDDADHAGEDRPVDEEVRKVHSSAYRGVRGVRISEPGARLRRAVLIETTVTAIQLHRLLVRLR